MYHKNISLRLAYLQTNDELMEVVLEYLQSFNPARI